MRLILLRHGETLWNKENRLQGHDNAPLSPRGIAQAEAIAPMVHNLSPARIVSSDLGRARQTAKIIGYPDAPVDARLRELNMGTWTGANKDNLMATQGDDYAAWRAGVFTPEGGETWPDFATRIHDALLEHLAQGEGDLLAVVHSGVVRAALFRFFNIPPHQLVPVTPGTLTILEFEAGKTTPKLEAYNMGSFVPDRVAAE